MNDALLIFYLRPGRRKARTVATAEALSLLRDLQATAPAGGPLSETGGLFWVSLPWDALETALPRLPRLGYTYAVDVLEPISEHPSSFDRARDAQEQLVRWHHKLYRLACAYKEDAQTMRESAPDRRTFLLETSAGTIRPVRGYRGDGRPSSRRGLPVCDARMLVNLVAAAPGTSLLDPFAGIGGIVIEALASGCRVTSVDCDPTLQAGLTHLGAQHAVADARHLPWAAETFDAIATEPPYHEEAKPMVIEALREMYRVLKTGGRLAILCVPGQADDLRKEGESLGLSWYLDWPVNRKGLDVVVLAGCLEKHETTSSRQQVPSWDEADQLISILRAWGISYLIGEDYPVDPAETSGDLQTTVTLIQRLAQCEYPRVRDASISLFLLHPELAPAVLEAIQVSEPAVTEQITTLVLATLYLQRLWSPRLTIAFGHVSGFPEEPFVDLWRSRQLPSPSFYNAQWGLLALQAFEQRRTGLPLNFLHDWQNQVDHLLLQEEAHYRHPVVPVGQVLKEDQPQYAEENVDMSMRPKVDKAAIDSFLKALGRAFRKPGRLYLVGGAALVHRGVRAGTTLEIDVEVSGENEGEMIESIRQLIRQLNINVEFASPGDFMPLPKHWMTQSQYVGRYGAVDVFYFDFYSIALSKIQRGSSLDINDVRLLLQQGIITLDGLDSVYKEVLVQVGKGPYAKLDPQRFAEHYAAVRQLL